MFLADLELQGYWRTQHVVDLDGGVQVPGRVVAGPLLPFVDSTARGGAIRKA